MNLFRCWLAKPINHSKQVARENDDFRGVRMGHIGEGCEVEGPGHSVSDWALLSSGV
jgi:hypothetical protein